MTGPARGPLLRIAPAARVTFDEEIVLRSGAGRLVLPGTAAPLVRAVLDAARVPRSRDAVLAAAGPHRGVAVDLVETLERLGVLTDSADHDPGRPPSGTEGYLRLRGQDAGTARRALAAARVLVLGTGDDDSAPGALRGSGIGTVVTAALPAAPAGDWDVVLADLTDLPAADVPGWVPPVPAPWLPVLRRGVVGVVGPLVTPGRAPCWTCAVGRLDDTLAVTSGIDPRVGLPAWSVLLRAAAVAEVVRAVAGDGSAALREHVVVHDLVGPTSTRHRVVALPGCVRHGRTRGPGRRAPEDAAEHLDALAPWIDARTGVVRRTRVRDPRPDEPRAPVCAHAFPAPPSPGTYPGPQLETAGGKGPTAADALRAAVCEAVERYCASVVPPARLVRSRARDLPGAVLTPRELGLHDDEAYASPGFGFRRPAEDAELAWVRGHRAGDGRPVWLPAAQVFYRTTPATGAGYCQVTSSGLAAGRDLRDATARAALELVERHALLTTWAQPTATRLDPAALPDRGLHEAVDELRRCGVVVELYLLPAPAGIPTVLCLGLGDGRTWPAAHVGVAADPDPATAARKATHEHTCSAVYYARLMRDGACPPPPAPDAVATFADHALLYTRRAALPAFDRLRSAPPGDPPTATGDPLPALERAGVRLAAVDLTSPDLDDAPLRVVRVLSPDLVPLHAGSRHALRNGASPTPGPGTVWPHPLC